MRADFNYLDYPMGIEIRNRLLHERGCQCAKCGAAPLPYNRAEMHHRNPRKKAFTLDIRTLHNLVESMPVRTAKSVVRREAAKCVLLCDCCHKEVHQTLDPRFFDRDYLESLPKGSKLDMVA